MRTKFLLVLVVMTAMGGALWTGPDEDKAEAAFLLSQVKKIFASDAQANDQFGHSVSVSGDTAIVASHVEDGGSGDPLINAGAVYIFQRDENGLDNWGEVKKLTSADAQAGDGFGFSVAIDGDTAVIGAPGQDSEAANAGAGYIFQRDQGGANNWGEVKKLTASDAETADFFGRGVSISGDTVIAGKPEDGAGNVNNGAAYVFLRDEGGADNWGEVRKLTASDAQTDDNFGYSVAISGNTAVVGATNEDGGGQDAGAAYIFQRDQGGADNWGEVNKIVASDAQREDDFGRAVAINSDTVVVGARSEDAGGSNAGAAYLFKRDQGGAENWGEVKKLIASDAETRSGFGKSVAVSGETIIVGSPTALNFGRGAVYVFQRDSGGADNWGEQIKLLPSDGLTSRSFGYSVSLAGVTALIGAIHEGTSGATGSAFIFEVPPKVPEPDDDNDGCSNARELGPDEVLGGLRDPNNPWDFYDVLGPGAALPKDGVIDLPNDILGVIQHFSPQGQAPYDVQFDRGPQGGLFPWNMTAPDGVIDLPNDILGVILQFNHRCV